MGFLIGSHVDDNGDVSMNVYYIYDRVGSRKRSDWNTISKPVTKDTFKSINKSKMLRGWIKVYDETKTNFRLHYICNCEDIGLSHHSVLQERDKRLYCVVDSKFLDIELEDYLGINEFFICEGSKHRYHYFDRLESYEELLAFVLESHYDVAEYLMK